MKLKITTLLITLLGTLPIFSQETQTATTPENSGMTNEVVNDTLAPKKQTLAITNFVSKKEYTLGGIRVTGLQKFGENTVKLFTGLETGQKVRIPGDKLSSAIKKLYDTKQFSNVDVYVEKLEGDEIYLEFRVEELPQLNEVRINGVSKGKQKSLADDTELKPGAMITDNLMVTSTNYFKKQFTDKGYLNTKVNINTVKDTANTNAVNMIVNIDKGEKVKIANITINGNEEVTSEKVRSFMKSTKQKALYRVWKASKLVDEKFQEDLRSIVSEYSRLGYRDARILGTKITDNPDGTINIDIDLEEGSKYYFGNIEFLGNKSYTDAYLSSILGIEEGETYNGEILKERVTGDGSPDSQDIQTLYSNSGFLFAQVSPVETSVINDTINVEIRISEDEKATIKRITVQGNDKTNDHVIMRSIFTRPGDLFSKDAIIRSIREIGQTGFFDAENIVPDVIPNYTDKTVDIEYTVAETGTSQIELQGGYGGGSFIGTLGLTFNNFSIANVFNKDYYKPLPSGDGQQLSLRLQKSQFYSTYSFSFSEPWLGGKAPKGLNFSVYNSNQYGYDYQTYDVDKTQGMSIIGGSIGLGKRLKWPDDYFYLRQTINVESYDLRNYQIGNLQSNNGNYNNISYGIELTRNSAGPSVIFPTSGSEISAAAWFTLPYSAFNDKDYTDPEMTEEERYKWLEYYKVNLKARWYTPIVGKLTLMTNAEFGFLGYYNEDVGYTPFERYFLGGDGMATYQLDGRETIALRGYDNARLSTPEGGVIYDKFTLEARYPITLKPSASIYALGFLEAGASFNEVEEFNPFQLQKSAGLGLRIFMPAFGLLGIDFAYGFDPIPGSSQISGWQTHFIIGQQF
ncbi:MAG: outer membrane protein assembly factor BamA [Flavobacteriaceae bacterium]